MRSCWFQVEFDIVRRHGSSGEVLVYYTTSPGTALPSPDQDALFVPTSGWLVYSDGGLGQQTVSVSLLDNGLLEGPRSFFVNITELKLVEPRYYISELYENTATATAASATAATTTKRSIHSL